MSLNLSKTRHAFVIAAAMVLLSSNAMGAVKTCLEIDVDDPKEAKGFEKLVRAEVATHPSHVMEREECETNLQVQLFEVAGSKQITVRVDQEVPVRYTIESKNMLAGKLRHAISLALGNDPTYLASDITKYSAAKRAVHDIRVLGHNAVRLELFETGIYTGKGTTFATGGAVGYGRGARHFQVFGRIFGMGSLGLEGEKTPFLKVATGADIGLAYETNALSSASGYFALGVSVRYMRFEGTVKRQDGVAFKDKADVFLPAVFGRVGVRLFRFNDFDFDLFLTGVLPFMRTADEQTYLFREKDRPGQYTPSLQAGIGIGFN